jgi:hypothetical protein
MYFKDFKSAMHRALGKGELPFDSVDIMAVPDYSKWLDDKLNKVSMLKAKNTNHVWRFSAISPTIAQPLGVQTEYRAFAENEVIEVLAVSDPSNSICNGYQSFLTHVTWRPLPLEAQFNFLLDYPSNNLISPAAFFEDCRDKLEEVVNKYKNRHQNQVDKIAAWNKFLLCFPCNGNVHQYINNFPSKCVLPLADIIFKNYAVDKVSNVPGVPRKLRKDPEIIHELKTTSNVTHNITISAGQKRPPAREYLNGQPFVDVKVIKVAKTSAERHEMAKNIKNLNIKKITVDTLKDMLTDANLNKKGLKEELYARLLDHYETKALTNPDCDT